MKNMTNSNANRNSLRALMLALTAMPLLLAGCAVSGGGNEPQTVGLQEIHGKVMGGEQPISGANIYYYAAGTTGYASLNTPINTAVTTEPDGSFVLTGHYTACTAGQQMYIVSQAGNAGAGTNSNQTTMAALGDCANITSSTYILINEVTTIAAAYALSPFATSYTNIGTDAGNVAGLKRAFANAAKLANTANGTALTTLGNGGTVPTQEINALADVLTNCVNSTGGSATDTSTNCGKLFSYTTPPSSGTAPTDTFGAALNFAKYPTNNTAQIFARIPSPAPFATTFSSANDLTLSIVYTGFNAPKSSTVDANGNVWVANSGNNTLTVLAQNGTAVSGSPFSGNGLNAPSAIAIDNTGNAWVANTGGTTVSAFTNIGGTVTSSPFTVGSAPNSLAFDASGNVWVANSTGNSVTELNSAGTLVQTISSGVTAPAAIVIDPK
jgi:DNA-binding beta-propeller fold protein YncE